MSREYHVAKTGNDKNCGTKEQPFYTISRAAKIAEEGDYVIVHEGVYREHVRPANGGRSDEIRITYEAVEGEKVIIKGSEEVKDWRYIESGVWKAEIADSVFGEYNPYHETIDGDWLLRPANPFLHTGQVYINGLALGEVSDIEKVSKKSMSWFSAEENETTVIYANFGDNDPNNSLIEINVRKCCFYPDKTGVNYITVRGFEMAHAACPWAPPTADQPGMLGVHWSKGWIIENNILHDARCSAISIGKEISTGHNLCSRYHRKPGYQMQLEAVFAAREIGWSKEHIGSHIIRNNTIYDCGQNAIVGHMGGAFSEIYGNHIYNIGNRHEFFGWEIAGIKLHAAIDTYIHHNNIHDCWLGTWLDWQAQGSRISCNLYYNNEKDLYIEVSHGPYIIDNNILGSELSVINASQGGAYIHNLFCGGLQHYKVLDRSTPYHLNHSTVIKGTAVVYGYDDRIYQNIFAKSGSDAEEQASCGTNSYDGCPSSMEEYTEQVLAKGRGDHEIYNTVNQPAYINGNCYFEGTKSFESEKEKFVCNADPKVKILTENENVYLEISIPEELFELRTERIDTNKLGITRISEAPYENSDGTPLSIDKDCCGSLRKQNPSPGPIDDIKSGYQKICIWKNEK